MPPRQTSKTSCLLSLMEYLNQHSKYKNVECAQTAREKIQEGMKSVIQELSLRSKIYLLSFNLGFSWHEICPLTQIAIFIKKFWQTKKAYFMP